MFLKIGGFNGFVLLCPVVVRMGNANDFLIQTATPEESKTCMPAEADSVFFMLKAKKKPESTRN